MFVSRSCFMLVASKTMMITMKCSASTINTNTNTDLLRSQLDQLHSEADVTRRKANNARFRLLRLSEAAENLCRQAAVSVRKRKEDYARDLLLQKKKIKLALEKSKGRVELLDELAAKLNEAISVKEAQLVRHVASDLEVEGDDAEGPVRIVSPTQNNYETLDHGDTITFNQSDVTEPKIGPDTDSHENTLPHSKTEEAIHESINRGLEAAKYSSFSDPLSFNDFLEDLDSQFDKIENNLKTILELSTAALENEEKPNDSRLHLLEILENIRDARASVRKCVQEFTGTK